MKDPFLLDEDVRPAWMQRLFECGSLCFGAAVAVRKKTYDAGWLTRVRVDRPVISVGNIVVGGSGKTPFVIFLARVLEGAGRSVAIVSRGYLGEGGQEHAPLVVSKGQGPLRCARDVGDEPVMIARRTRSAVVVAHDRAAGARLAIDELGADIILLDDGFQHFRLRREMDIVLVDGRAPVGNGRLLPGGFLRERPEALQRADLVIINLGTQSALQNGSQHASQDEEHVSQDEPQAALRAALEIMPAGVPWSTVSIVPIEVGPIHEGALRDGVHGGGRRPAAEAVAGRRVALLAGIARPSRFAQAVSALGGEVVYREFYRDHAWLNKDLVENFERCAMAHGAELLLTTEKDAVRIPADTGRRLECLAIELRMESGLGRLEDGIHRSTGVDVKPSLKCGVLPGSHGS